MPRVWKLSLEAKKESMQKPFPPLANTRAALIWLGFKSRDREGAGMTPSIFSQLPDVAFGSADRAYSVRQMRPNPGNPGLPIRFLERKLDNMTIYGHNLVMKQAKVSELKARLSSYLAEVKSGDTVTVCERATPIARLVPFKGDAEDFEIRESRESIGRLTRIRPVRLRKKADVNKILRETRGEE